MTLVAVVNGNTNCLAWAPRGDRLVVGSWKRPSLALARIADGPILESARGLGHEDLISRIITIPGKYPGDERVFTSARDGTIRAWGLTRLASRHALNQHERPVRTVAATADGERLVSCGSDNKILVWDQRTGKCLATIQAAARVAEIAPHPSADRFVLAGAGLWRLESATGELEPLASPAGEFNDVAWRPDGAAFVSVNSTGNVALHAPDGNVLATCTVTGKDARCVAFSTAGSTLLTAGMNGRLQEWTGNELAPLHDIGDVGHVTDIAYLPGPDKHAISASNGNQLVLWRRHGDGTFTRELIDRGHFLQRIVFHPTEPRLFTFSANGRVSIWDTNDWHRLATLPGHRTMIIDACFVPATDELVTAGMDRTVRIWRTTR